MIEVVEWFLVHFQKGQDSENCTLVAVEANIAPSDALFWQCGSTSTEQRCSRLLLPIFQCAFLHARAEHRPDMLFH